MKTKITDNSVIESTRYLVDVANTKEDAFEIIKGISFSHQLTPDFIREFHKYMNKEIFTKSMKLQLELVNLYPDLFDEDLFLNSLNSMPTYLSLSMLNKYFDRVMYACENIEELLKIILRDCDPSEITVENISNIFCKGYQDIDTLILKLANDEIRDGLIFSTIIEKDTNISSGVYRYMSNEMKDSFLTEETFADNFVKILSESDDLGWKSKMIKKAVDGEIIIKPATTSMTSELSVLFSKLPNKDILEFLKLKNIYNQAFSYKLFLWLLKEKDFSENELIEIYPLLKEAGLYFEIKNIAKQHNYKKLLEVM